MEWKCSSSVLQLYIFARLRAYIVYTLNSELVNMRDFADSIGMNSVFSLGEQDDSKWSERDTTTIFVVCMCSCFVVLLLLIALDASVLAVFLSIFRFSSFTVTSHRGMSKSKRGGCIVWLCNHDIRRRMNA